MTEMYRSLVFKYSIFSRIVFMYFCAVCNTIFPDHEPIDAFKSPGFPQPPNSQLDKIIEFFAGGLLRWDAHHYIHIAHYGYTYENNLAFFPLYPLVLRYYGVFIEWILYEQITQTTVLLISAVIVNIALFSKTCLCLYDLTEKLYHNTLFAYKAAMFFCLSPATVFFLAPYSEVVFSFCVFRGMLFLANNNKLYATLLFALSSATRSNGILNSGFIIHSILFNISLVFKSNHKITIGQIVQLFKLCGLIFLTIATITLPYFVFQYFGFSIFCKSNDFLIPNNIIKYAVENNLIMPSNGTDWCHDKLPLPYFHIQNKYWSVGFLQYYKLSQIPNFILALPIILMILSYAVPYLYLNRTLFLKPKFIYKHNVPKSGNFTPTLPRYVFVHVCHITFLTLFCIFFINIQVTTRIIASSSPVIYWIASGECIKLLKSHAHKKKKSKSFLKLLSGSSPSRGGMYIRCFFIIYAVAGMVLFSNNLPWT